jgi:predicted dehydrogenase
MVATGTRRAEPRIALVGCGRWGRLIARDLTGLGAAVIVVDPTVEAQAFAHEMGLERLELVSELAGAGVDGVVVATPASTHAAVLSEVAGLGVPVFCEKPLTVDVAEAERVVERLGDRLHVMYVWRYHRGIELLGELARSGELGSVHGVRTTRTNWTSPRTDVDSIWTLVPHDLTVGIEILGVIPPANAALAEVIDGRAVSLWAHLGGGSEPWIVVEASTRFADRRREVRVHGSRATATLTDDGSNAVVVAEGSDLDPRVRSIAFDPDPPLRRELAAWLSFMAGGVPPKSDGTEGLDVVRRVADLRMLAGLGPVTS